MVGLPSPWPISEYNQSFCNMYLFYPFCSVKNLTDTDAAGGETVIAFLGF